MRRGLGLGRGKGYRNIRGNDPRIHGDSAKGIKQPQRVTMSDDAFRCKLAKFGIRSVQAPFMRRNRLPLQIGIIVPSTKRDKPIPAPDFRKRVQSEKRWFSHTFGGDTSIGLSRTLQKGVDKKDEQPSMVGSYWDGKKVIKEGNVLIQSSTTIESYNNNKKFLIQHLRQRKKDWKQQSLFVRIEGQDFIYPKQKVIADDKGQSSIIPVQ